MSNSFSQMLFFQVKPDRLDAFELRIKAIQAEQEKLPGCISVKYYSYLEFDTIENCGKANGWFFDHYAKDVMKLLIMPFEINSGYSIC